MKSDPIWSTPEEHLRKVLPDTAQLYVCPAEVQQAGAALSGGLSGAGELCGQGQPCAGGAGESGGGGDAGLRRGIHPRDAGGARSSARRRSCITTTRCGRGPRWRRRRRSGSPRPRSIARASWTSWARCRAGRKWRCGSSCRSRARPMISGRSSGRGRMRRWRCWRQVAAMGFTPAMTFHPGTQCGDAGVWASYIRAARTWRERAGVRLARLNVGGGFRRASRCGAADLEAIFARIGADGSRRLWRRCARAGLRAGARHGGRGLSAGHPRQGLRGDAVYMNDGIYGALAEWRDIAAHDRIRVVTDGWSAACGRACAAYRVRPDLRQHRPAARSGAAARRSGRGAIT